MDTLFFLPYISLHFLGLNHFPFAVIFIYPTSGKKERIRKKIIKGNAKLSSITLLIFREMRSAVLGYNNLNRYDIILDTCDLKDRNGSPY